MREITMKELEAEHEPRYKVEYWMPGSTYKYHRDCWNPVLCKDFIRSLDPSYIVKIYKIR